MQTLSFTLATLPGFSAFAAEPAANTNMPPVEQVLSLNGSWRFEPSGAGPREVMVPGFWDRLPGMGNVHVATFRREFDIPGSFAGRRVFLKFDAVGDGADVSVNGKHAGGYISAALPFTVDITGLVAVPSVYLLGHRLPPGPSTRLRRVPVSV